MKIATIFFFSMILTATAHADYDPFNFKCVYDATSDGMITLTTDIRPDTADFSISMKSDQQEETTTFEAQHVFVHYPSEIPAENLKHVQKLAQVLKIDWSSVFTVTDVLLAFTPGQVEMSVYKFSTENSDLGIGIHSVVFGNSYYTPCLSVK